MVKYLQYCRSNQNQGFPVQILVEYFQYCRNCQNQRKLPEISSVLLLVVVVDGKGGGTYSARTPLGSILMAAGPWGAGTWGTSLGSRGAAWCRGRPPSGTGRGLRAWPPAWCRGRPGSGAHGCWAGMNHLWISNSPATPARVERNEIHGN